MRRTAILYAPSVVLLAWAAAWAAGFHQTGVVVTALVSEAAAVFFHIGEQVRYYGAKPSEAEKRFGRRADDRRRSYRDVWLIAISGVVVWSLFNLTSQQSQFCDLIDARLKDYDVRVAQANDFLRGDKARRESPELVRTIREVTLPSIRRARRVERRNYPSTCGDRPRR